MAQRPVYLAFGDWTQLTVGIDEQFTAVNKTPQDLLIFFSDVKPPIEDNFFIDGAFESQPGKSFQRPDDAPLGSHCWVKLTNDNVDRNFRAAVAVTSA